jgi:hypothetical protein
MSMRFLTPFYVYLSFFLALPLEAMYAEEETQGAATTVESRERPIASATWDYSPGDARKILRRAASFRPVSLEGCINFKQDHEPLAPSLDQETQKVVEVIKSLQCKFPQGVSVERDWLDEKLACLEHDLQRFSEESQVEKPEDFEVGKTESKRCKKQPSVEEIQKSIKKKTEEFENIKKAQKTDFTLELSKLIMCFQSYQYACLQLTQNTYTVRDAREFLKPQKEGGRQGEDCEPLLFSQKQFDFGEFQRSQAALKSMCSTLVKGEGMLGKWICGEGEGSGAEE